MSEKVYVVPAAGLRVVDPASGQPLPATGAEVERNTYWIRRLNDGDVTEGTPPASAATKAASKKE
jgi:hypothetical protein